MPLWGTLRPWNMAIPNIDTSFWSFGNLFGEILRFQGPLVEHQVEESLILLDEDTLIVAGSSL